MNKRGHGGDIYSFSTEKGIKEEEILDFSANINPLGIPKRIKEAAIYAIEKCTAYPDPQCRKLRRAIALFEEVKEDYIVCGNGAADIIFRLVYGQKPQCAMILAPTFSEYEEALKASGTEVSYYTLKEEEGFCLTEEVLGALHDELDMVFICNPNNPTGQVVEKALVKKILDKCQEKQITLVMDECFNDFLETPETYSMKEFIASYPQLFILKAFTKMYAIPGIRIGYGISSNQLLLEGVERSGQAWSVSTIAQEVGICATREKDYVEATKELILKEKKYLKEELKSLGMIVYEPYANYIFFKNPIYKDLDKQLRKEGILIRSCSNYRGLDERFYRIAVKTHEDNEKLIKIVKRIGENLYGKSNHDTGNDVKCR